MSLPKPIAKLAPLLVLLALSAPGCAHRVMHSNRCGAVLDDCLLVRAVDSLLDPKESIGCAAGCETIDCGNACVAEEVSCEAPPACYSAPPVCSVATKPRREPGPPPERYLPPMPPRFLAVPRQPAYTEVADDAPLPAFGSVERDFGPPLQLTSPGRD